MQRETVAIIPARGGSKAVPRKNLTLLCGKPLLGWTIDAARAARRVDRVVVSTDDPEIAQVARSREADVVMRPLEISGDEARSEEALLHVLGQLSSGSRPLPDTTVFLQCTSPLTLPEDIDGTLEALEADRADTALAVAEFHYFVWCKDRQLGAVGVNHDRDVRLLRQQRQPQYLETGAVYTMRTAGFLEARHRFFGRTALYVMPGERCYEIDDPTDLRVAEMLLRRRQQADRLSRLPARIAAVVFDFDGVLTDNRVIVLEDGREAVACHRGDGLGLSRLRRSNVALLVISSETNSVVQARCAKLDLPCLSGVRDKLPVLQHWMAEAGFAHEQLVYVGNDANDVDCLRWAACGIAVGDATAEARSAADIVLDRFGGAGAVREVADLVVTRQQGGRRRD